MLSEIKRDNYSLLPLGDGGLKRRCKENEFPTFLVASDAFDDEHCAGDLFLACSDVGEDCSELCLELEGVRLVS